MISLIIINLSVRTAVTFAAAQICYLYDGHDRMQQCEWLMNKASETNYFAHQKF